MFFSCFNIVSLRVKCCLWLVVTLIIIAVVAECTKIYYYPSTFFNYKIVTLLTQNLVVNKEFAFPKTTGFNRTFMELKGANETCRGLCLWFQSHLYGIERPLYSSPSSSMGVSIAPLWNWKFVFLYFLGEVTTVSIAPLWNWKFLTCLVNKLRLGFNRTFMELKGRSRISFRAPPAVSIAPLWNWKADGDETGKRQTGFNRTFMELKDEKRNVLVIMRGFQSHLYGIERLQRHGVREPATVSIAPLWNWKQVSSWWSHYLSLVSIAPLWNWKQ